jgi:GntR family transcriptional repressor for pyruvate dehydrogenase complex
MTLTAIDRSPSLVEKVCQRLSELASQNAAENDGWLPTERRLATQLKVSRSVVREAAKCLELQGMIEIRQGLGVRVVNRLHKPLNSSIALLINNDAQRLRQSLEVRVALEPEVARLATLRATAATRRELKAVHLRLEKAVDLHEAVDADLEFHHTLAKMSGNDIFVLMLTSMAELGRESRLATISFAGVEVAKNHHEKILKAVLEGDAAKAEASMRYHVNAALQDLSGTAKKTSTKSGS